MDHQSIILGEYVRKGQKSYDFTHMWDIKLKATNEQTNKNNAQTRTTVWWFPESVVGPGEEGKIYGDRRLDLDGEHICTVQMMHCRIVPLKPT